MNHTPLAASVVAVILVTAASSARAEKPKVGITVAVKVNVSDIEARILSDSLGNALRSKFDVDVVAGEDADAKLPEGGLPETCIAETECLRTTAESLGVDKLLVLVAVRVGDSVQVDATLFDAATGSSNTRPPVRMTDRERQWQDAFVKSAADILPGVEKRKDGGTGDSGDGNTNNGNTGNGNTGNGNVGNVTRESPGFIATRRTAGWIFGGVMLAGVAVGAVTGLQALGNEDCTNEGVFSSCPAATVATVSFATAAVAGGLFIYYFFLTEKQPPTAERSITLQPGPGDAGLAVGGRF